MKYNLGVILIFAGTCLSASGLQAQTATIPVDPAIAGPIQRSLLAMGVRNDVSQQTIVLNGVITVSGDKPASLPIVIKARGCSDIRSELTTAQGVRTTITSNGHRSFQRTNGAIRHLADENATGDLNEYVPAFSLSCYQLPKTSLQYLGSTASSDGATKEDVIAFGRQAASSSDRATRLSQASRTLFYLDQNTGYVTRRQRLHYSETVSSDTQTLEILYSDYRDASGIMIPFHQQTLIDGKLLLDLTINSVDLSAPLSDSDFSLNQ